MKLSENTILLIFLILTLLVYILYLIISSLLHTRKPKSSAKKDYEAHFPEYMYNDTIYAPIKGKGFGISVQDLEQPISFYKNMRNATLKYLSGVYPNGMNSISSLGDLELASFFNSLTYYYNCDFNYQGNDLQSNNGEFPVKWDKLPCANEYPLPYPPQGWFFDWTAFNSLDIPYTYSDSTGGKQRLSELGSCRPGIAFINYGPKVRSGPGTLYVNCRTAIRNAYRPRGVINTAAIPPKKDGKYMWPPWARMNVISNRNMPWNYPWGWQNGVPDYQHIEVCHTQPTPGMVQSQGWWFNAMVGTGMFLNVGKSFRSPTKVSAMFTLLNELKKKDPEKMKKHFGGLTDAYMICWYQFAYHGWERNAGFQDNTFCQWKYVACDQWKKPDSMGAGSLIGNQTPNIFWNDTLDYAKTMNIPLNNDGSPSYAAIKAAIDASMNQSNYPLSRMAVSPLCDEPIFFLVNILDYDTVQFPLDPNGNGYYTVEIMDCRVPNTGRFRNIKKEIANRDYSTFVGNTFTGKNGKLGPLPDIVSPTETISEKNPMANGNAYYQDFIDAWMQKIKDEKIVTIRDPLDITNNDKVESCIGVEIVPNICPNNKTYNGAWYNLTCNKIPLATSYRCLQLGQDAGDNACQSTGNNPTC